MKFTSREIKIREYNTKYSTVPSDALERIRQYFSTNNINIKKACEKAAKKATKILKERSYETIRITLYEIPFSTPRPRVTRSGHAFSPNAAANKEYIISVLSKVTDTIKLITSPAEIVIDAYLEMPNRVPPDEVILFESKLLVPIDKPDGDNIAKTYMDMLTDTLLCDDSALYKIVINKWYSLLPRVELRLTYQKANDSEYIYKKLKSRKAIKEGLKSGQITLEKLSF